MQQTRLQHSNPSILSPLVLFFLLAILLSFLSFLLYSHDLSSGLLIPSLFLTSFSLLLLNLSCSSFPTLFSSPSSDLLQFSYPSNCFNLFLPLSIFPHSSPTASPCYTSSYSYSYSYFSFSYSFSSPTLSYYSLRSSYLYTGAHSACIEQSSDHRHSDLQCGVSSYHISHRPEHELSYHLQKIKSEDGVRGRHVECVCECV